MTYITKMRLKGFKSFANPVDLEFKNNYSTIIGPNGSGKSTSGNTDIMLSNGREIKIKKLVEDKLKKAAEIKKLDDGVYCESKEPVKIISLNPVSMKNEEYEVSKFIKRDGEPYLYEIKTNSGKKVTCTGCHPVMVFKDGKIVSSIVRDLNETDLIASPRIVQTSSMEEDTEFARLFGYILGDGYITHNRIEFVNSDSELIEDCKDLVRKVFNHEAQYEKDVNSVVRLIYWQKEIHERFKSLLKNKEDKYTSEFKHIPNYFLGKGLATTANLLAGLFDTDGTIDKNKNVIEFCSKNEKLAGQVQRLLLRFGIVARKKERLNCATNTIKKIRRKYYYLYIDGYENIKRFYENIPLRCKHKHERLKNHVLDAKISNPNVDVLPKETNLLIRRAVKLLGISCKPLKRQYPKLGAYLENRCHPTRQGLKELIPLFTTKLLKIYSAGLNLKKDQSQLVEAMNQLGMSGAETGMAIGLHKQTIRDKWATGMYAAKPKNLDNFFTLIQTKMTSVLSQITSVMNTLYSLANSDIFWDEIVSIKKVKGEEFVYDLTIPNNHNFVANGIFVHNSNVMDALIFVLGTTSAKAMRAEKSANLIFNGGKKGSPMREAEVSISFDNSKNEFPLKTPEVSISRVIKQAGTSVYKINDEVKTRTEVVELLNHASIDPDGHNIVLQGDIVRFMEMKPDERKEIIENVAGITIFDDKKHKAMLELTHVDEKLNEANIILTERKTYLKELKKERDHALKYRELEKNIKSNKATNLHLQINNKEEERDEVDSRLKKNNDELAKINSKINAVQDKISEGKKTLDSINKDIEEKGEVESVKIQKDIEALRSEFIKKSERLNTCNNETKKISERIKQLKINLDDTDGNITELKKSEKDLIDRLKKLEESNSKLEERLKKFKSEHGVFDSSDIDSIEKQTDEVQKSIFKLQEDRNKLLQKKFQFDNEIKSIEESLKASTSSEYKKLKDNYDSSQDKLAKLIAEESVITTQLNKARRDINEKNTEMFKLQGKSASAREFLSSDMALKRVLDSKIKGVYGTISQLGKVDSKYALALEVSAGPRLKGVVVEDDGVAAECIKILKASKLGTCVFLPLNKIKKSDSRPVQGVIANALEVISYDKKFHNAFSYVFGGTFIVNDVESARKIGVGSARMVTLDGDLFETSGAIIGGHRKLSKGISLIEKDSDVKLEKFESDIKDLAKLIDTLENRYADVSNSLQDARKSKSSLEGELIRMEKSTGLADAERLKKRLSELKEDKIFTELKSLESEISEKSSKLDSLRKEREKLRSNLKDMRNPEVASSLNDLEGKKQRTIEEMLQLRTDLKNIETQVTNIYNPEKQRTLEIIKQHEKELNDFTSESVSLGKDIKEKEFELKDSTEKEAKFQKDYKGLFEKRNKVNDDIRNLESSISIENVKIKEIENRVNNASISRAKVIAELEGLMAEFEQFKGIPLRKAITQEELKVEIRNFEKLMVEMGNVNLKALEVYETIEKEYEELINKAATLDTEKTDVLNMITEIEKKKKGLFIKTFKVINENFQRIFVSLSTKGEAFLELENKEDPLSAGIEIRVRLAGNKYLDIKSLSGGEKTLAALAFIFAIQEHQPSSFYLLDEVDAALDKTNSHLLSTLVAKYSKGAQYILISHNDTVISEADQIYGVSMQENGISKVISLKI